MKQEQIVDAAIKRFSHFGIHKTNLGEIADDLGISRPALFYYFPDKERLVAAVEQKIVNEYITELRDVFSKTASVEEALSKLIEVRSSFLERYFMLVNRLDESDTYIPGKTIHEVKQNFRQREAGLLVDLFRKGKEKGEIRDLDATRTGMLMLDTVSALAHCFTKKHLPPDEKTLAEISKKQKQVLHLFYTGLKHQSGKPSTLNKKY